MPLSETAMLQDMYLILAVYMVCSEGIVLMPLGQVRLL